MNRQSILERQTLFAKVNSMTALAAVWKRRREGLKNKRTQLFKRYRKSPNDLCIALEIKMIDDQIAECTQQIELENTKAAISSGSLPMTAKRRTRPAFTSVGTL